MSTEHPALFVVGCGRSGTTLLRSMLDAHPELAIPGESHFLRRMLRLRRRYEHGSQFDLERYVADLSRDVRFRRWVADPEPLIERIRAGRPHSLADAVRATFGAYARSQDKIRWGDKTPDYVTMMPPISELLPEARFVHLIRDGRAVAASLAHQSWGPSRIDTAALHWVDRVTTGRRGGLTLGPDRYLEMRYEALLETPESALRQICAFVELDFDPAVLDRQASVERAARQVLATGSHLRLAQPLDVAEPLETWNTLSPHDQAMALGVAGGLLDEMGYLPGGCSLQSPSVRRRARRHERLEATRRLPARVRAAASLLRRN